MNSDGNAGLGSEFDIDKILAEVKGLKNAGAGGEENEGQTKALPVQETNLPSQAASIPAVEAEPLSEEKDYSIYTRYTPPEPGENTVPGADYAENDVSAPEPETDDGLEPEPDESLYEPNSYGNGEELEEEVVVEVEVEVEAAAEEEEAAEEIEEDVEVEIEIEEEIPLAQTSEPTLIFKTQEKNDYPEEIVIEPIVESVAKPESQQKTSVFDLFSPAAPSKLDNGVPLTDFPEYNGGMETDEARERFLHVLELDKTAEHEVYNANETIEKPGVILEKSRFSKTSDLEPLPTVIPAEEVFRAAERAEEKTRISGSEPAAGVFAKETDGMLDGQIILRDFVNGEIQAEKVSEKAAEIDLIARRLEKAKNFKVIGVPGEEDEQALAEKEFESFDGGSAKKQDEDAIPVPARKKKLEYTFPEQKNRIYSSIYTARKRATIGSAALVIIDVLCLGLLLVPKLFEASSIDPVLFGADGKAYLFLNLLLLAFASFFCIPGLISGFRSLFKLKPNCDTAVSLAVALCAAQIITALFLPGQDSRIVTVYAAAAIFGLFLNSLGRKISHSGALENFRFCAFDSPENLYSINEVEESSEAFEIGRGILMGNPTIAYSCKTGFPSEFIGNARDVGLAERFSAIILLFASGVSMLIGTVVWVRTKDFFSGFSIFTGAMCLGIPAGSLLASAIPLRAANKRLNASGAMISNQSAAEECAMSNAVVVDSADIFDRSRCDMHGMKEYKNFRLDDVLLYTAAMVIKSEGPLTDVFDKVIANHRELLPPVKSLSYEDRQGLNALIHGQKVLLGNRAMLVNHSIEVPCKSDEDKYTRGGRRVMYLAIANKIAALFVVRYAADETLLPYLNRLQNDGVQLLVRTFDANITEDLIADCFNLPINGVKVISATAGRLFKRCKGKIKETAPARVLHNGSALTLLKSIAAAGGLNIGIRAAQIAQAAGVGIGLLGLSVLAFLSMADRAGAFQIIVFQAVFVFISCAASFLKRVN